jgi:UDP-3-O-[3-hydroxymyristoyl] glucosamine N-acyltransferase
MAYSGGHLQHSSAYTRNQAATTEWCQEPSYIAKTASYGQNVFIGAFAYLGENVKVGNNTKIFPHVYLGDNVTIGDNSIIHPGVKIYHDCKVGSQVTIHGGTVIGSDGFGYAPQSGRHRKKSTSDRERGY